MPVLTDATERKDRTIVDADGEKLEPETTGDRRRSSIRRPISILALTAPGP